MFKEVTKNFLLFFLPTLICGVLLVINGEEIGNSDPAIFPSFLDIIYNNFVILFFLILSGLLSRFIPYFIFYFNALAFSVFIVIYGNYVEALFRILPYGILEVLAYSMACYIGVNIKVNPFKVSTKLSMIAGVVLFISAIIESLIIKGVS